MRYAIIAALATFASAVPTNNVKRHILHEKRDATKAWVKRDAVPEHVELPMRIGMVQQNLHRGHDLLMEVSDPESPSYGQYYTAEQIHDLFAPSEESVAAIRGWLQAAGIAADRVSQSANKQWMEFDAKASEAEELLKTKFHIYEHAPSGKMSVGCDEYHVHEDVKHHVDYITPGIRLLGSKKREDLEKRTFGWGGAKPTPPLLQSKMPVPLSEILLNPLLALCDVAITPPCIEAMYNFTKATSAVEGNELGIFEDLGDYVDRTDLTLFFATFQPRIPIGTHPTLDSVDGGTPPNNVLTAGPESNLDFQISYPIIYPQKSILFQTDDTPTEANYTALGFFNNFLDAIDGSYCSTISPLDPQYPDPKAGGYKKKLQCGVYKPTNVISLSYGGQEADLPSTYQQRQCAEYMKLGMQGVSIVFASGDSGVAGPANDDNTDGCLGPNGTVFSPDFPAACPYVTSAGATFLPIGGDVTKDQETATTRFPSGGGFSNIFPIPSYQAAAVQNYYSTAKPPYPFYTGNTFGNGIYNRSGRGYPDVSAVGDNIIIFIMGAPMPIGGTSAAAPTFAALLTRINNERLAAGKSTIGFVNPALYQNPHVLHDITVGTNPGCNTNGFSASVGWDPLTGLGTPNYPAMLALFMSMK